ncbi:AAA family ATPase [Thermodesulfobacteriota bacterium]
MTVFVGGRKYTPGMYAKKRLSTAELVERYMKDREQRRLQKKKGKIVQKIPPTICFSRKIGVGALEVADILSERIGYQVFDRQILEKIASQAKLSEKTVAFFDEIYPGRMSELLAMIFGEKSFIKSDYTRHLFSAVLSIAFLEPAIFVGRGTHLILPRDRTLAVRFIGGRNHRIKRLTKILKVDESGADKKLNQIDKEQKDFFKKVYGKKEASPYEFDLVINFDYIGRPKWAADIVEAAFKTKFGDEIESSSV